MANTYTQMYLQIIFAAKYRKAVLDKKWRHEIFGVIGNLINETGCKTHIVNGMDDHVHCLVGLKPVVTISDLMKVVKAKSSKYINDHSLTSREFRWQVGYGAFTYSQSQIDKVYRYIHRQEEHHKKMTFREEYIGLLNKFNIEYDEKYIFHELL